MNRTTTLVAFSSPKGGVGRTMLMANMAAIVASGVSHAGLAPEPVLALDLDFEGPGLHYYNFASEMEQATGLTYWYRFRNREYQSHDSLINALLEVKENVPGLLYWFSAILRNERVCCWFRDLNHGATSYDETVQQLTSYFFELQGEYTDKCNPFSHLVEVFKGGEDASLLIFPAANPLSPTYADAVLNFDWNAFVKDQNGVVVLDTLLCLFLPQPTGIDKPRYPEARWIMLDQGAGRSIPGFVNQRLAHFNVLVSGLNLQNQAGLYGAVADLKSRENLSNARVILSQHVARHYGFKSTNAVSRFLPHTPMGSRKPHDAFLAADQRRVDIANVLKREYDLPSQSIYTVDFHVDAIQTEFFFPSASPSYDELVMLAVSLCPLSFMEDRVEAAYQPKAAGSRGGSPSARAIRILGEFVGSEDGPGSGPLLGLCEAITHMRPDLKPCGYAVRHEDIATLLLQGQLSLKAVPTPEDDEFVKRFESPRNGEDSGSYKCYEPSYFDIIATPLYLVRDALDMGHLCVLDGPAGNGVTALDHCGEVTKAYLARNILGWTRYAMLNDHQVIGYPLFVDYPLLAWNESLLGSQFVKDYYDSEHREFRGFVEPADLLCVARAAAQNDLEFDRVIMSLKGIAEWYEWLAYFSACELHIPGESDTELTTTSRSIIKSETVVRATRFFLEIASYAEPKSGSAGWIETTKLFYVDEKVGVTLFWPDAIPREFRQYDKFKNRRFIYSVLPGGGQREECWLLTVPKGNSRWTPEELERLLVQFMTLHVQREYQNSGGLSTHRRVLLDLDQWRKFPFLLQLAGLFEAGYTRVRPDEMGAYGIATEVVKWLQNLRDWVLRELERSVNDRNVSENALWQDRTFVTSVEDEIRKVFGLRTALPD